MSYSFFDIGNDLGFILGRNFRLEFLHDEKEFLCFSDDSNTITLAKYRQKYSIIFCPAGADWDDRKHFGGDISQHHCLLDALKGLGVLDLLKNEKQGLLLKANALDLDCYFDKREIDPISKRLDTIDRLVRLSQ